jgi:hypothetical protein
MADRNSRFTLKRSGVAGKIPTSGDLVLGEVALNFADVILYASGTTANTILPIGWDRIHRTGDTMTGTLFTPTISATTYLNLPIDVRITGATYNNANQFTYTNNTGGTFSTLFNTVTGLTVNGGLTVTGTTTSGILSATTISGGTLYGDGTNLTGIANSALRGYGQINITNSGAETVITGTSVPTKIAGTTSAATLNLFSAPIDNRLQYTGSTTQKFHVTVAVTCETLAGNRLIETFLTLNGNKRNDTIMQTLFGANPLTIGINGIMELSTNDYLEVWTQNNTSSTNVIYSYMTFVVVQI